MSQLVIALLWFSAVACGLMAGLYFAFSAFIMQALASIDRSGVEAMNAINRVILRSLFMPLFFGSSLASLGLAVIGLIDWGAPGSGAMLAGGLIYFVGQFVVTMVCNVPINNALAAIDPSAESKAAIWKDYFDRWTRWNHVRTISCTVAMVLFIIAIGQR